MGANSMSFMNMYIYDKGATYCADCARCGQSHYTHEWTNDDHNDRRDAMQAGTLRCDECSGTIAPDTFIDCGRQYAGRYSAPGYMDCTSWSYNANKRALASELRDMYGNN